ncbi:MAG: cytidine deaminase [Clostridia bacterium]|nr:cytidine deaminase [Clostridia bacterium]
MTDVELMQEAYKAREFAYAPYSNYMVGAALLCSDGKVYHGCNVESATDTPTICAERTAISKAVSEGRRDFIAIAIAGGRRGSISPLCAPCGVCRQVIAEFCDDDFKVVLGTTEKIKICKFGELLPFAFRINDVQ